MARWQDFLFGGWLKAKEGKTAIINGILVKLWSWSNQSQVQKQ